MTDTYGDIGGQVIYKRPGAEMKICIDCKRQCSRQQPTLHLRAQSLALTRVLAHSWRQTYLTAFPHLRETEYCPGHTFCYFKTFAHMGELILPDTWK